MSRLTVVVVGSDKAAKIAAKRAQESNLEARVVLLDPHSVENLSLDMDAKAILFEENNDPQRLRFDSLIFTGGSGEKRTIFEKSVRFLPEFSFEISKLALQSLKQSGIKPQDWQAEHAKQVPDLDLLVDAGALTAKDGTIFVDKHMSTSLDGVYACGHAVSLLKAISSNRHHSVSDSMMQRAAQVAGANAASNHHVDALNLCAGTEVVSIGDQHFARTGLSQTELFRSGEYARATLCDDQRMVRLVAAKSTCAIISGELVGEAAFTAHINLISLCIVNALGAEALIGLDVPPLLREAAEQVRAELSNETQSISGEKLALWIAEARPFRCVDVSENPSGISRFVKSSHLPLKELSHKTHLLEGDDPLIVSSESGRSAVAAFRLLKKKLTNKPLFYLEGGTKAAQFILEN